MHFAAFETVAPRLADTTLPCRLEQSSSRLRPVMVLALLVPVAVLTLVPFLLVVSHVAAAPNGLDLVTDHPASVLQIVLGFTLAAALVGWPLSRAIERFNRARSVTIDHNQVHVTDRSWRGEHHWSEPLSAFSGVAHHIRTTHSITRHELVLVNPDSRRHVLLMIADRISKAEVEAVAARLGIPEVSPRLLYGRHTPISRPATPSTARIGGEALVPIEV